MLTSKSFAKINLYLEVTGNNKQGYHLLDSLMAPIELHDIIKIEKGTNLNLIINGPYCNNLQQNSKDNIIIQTINFLAKEYNINSNLKITLTKNIPIGAGLGGGSANAATVLLMLNKIYNLNLSIDKLKEIGLNLGCDVPFCLHQKIALISGVGDKIADVKIKEEDLFLLIVNPKKHLSTKKVFNLFKEKYKNITDYQKQIINDDNLINIIKNRSNHLQNAANDIVPQISQIISELNKQNNCLIARMSGSGATCFGLFKTESDLRKAKENIEIIFPDFYIKESKIIYALTNN